LTHAGALFAKDTLEAFRKGLAQGAETADLDHGPIWETAFSAPDRCSFAWKEQKLYTLKAPESGDWTWIRRDHNGARSGYAVSLAFAEGNDAHVWLAPYTPEKGIRVDIGRRDVVVRQHVIVDRNDKEIILKKVDLPTPIEECVVSVVPHDGPPLLYLNDRFLFVLPESAESLPTQMWVGCSGGTVHLRSIRVVDPKAY
jgi:hypothetical protein